MQKVHLLSLQQFAALLSHVAACCAASQVITRLLTFSLNLLTARSLTPEAYGVSTFRT